MYKSTLQRHILDTIKIHNWATTLSEIKEQETECQKYFDVIGSANLDDAFKEQHEHIEKLFQSQRKTFEAWNVDRWRRYSPATPEEAGKRGSESSLYHDISRSQESEL